MKILLLQVAQGPDIVDCPPALALRKIEQGKAVPVKDTTKAAKREKTAVKAGDA